MDLTARIGEILKHQRLTSSQFADQVGVQRSSMSHIVSGRNKPSLDFIQKVLTRYTFINSDWLLFGKGDMTKEMKQRSLFDMPGAESVKSTEGANEQSHSIPPPSVEPNVKAEPKPQKSNENDIVNSLSTGEIEQIVVFYKNGSFKHYKPS